MDFWRGEAYSKYFDYLDSTGGFYYEVCTFLGFILCAWLMCFIHRGGVTLQCIASERRSSRRKSKSTSLTTLATNTTLTSIARKAPGFGNRTTVLVIPLAALVSASQFSFRLFASLMRPSLDYDGYSCMRQWDRIQ